MKKKTYYYIDRWKKKIMKGKDKEWNTLEVNENRLKWDKFYKQKIIDRFQSMYDNRSEVIKMKIPTARVVRKTYKENKAKPYLEYVPKALVGIIQYNERLRRESEELNTQLKGA